MAYFDRHTEVLKVSVCDFGVGIPASVRKFCPDIVDSEYALKKAMEEKFTTGSTSHNAGFGLGNIKRSCTERDYLWIISNDAVIVINGENEKTFKLDFNFEGTLLLYSISLSHFNDEEVETEFNW